MLLEQVDLVFRGTVTEVEQLGPNENWAHRLAFEVHEFWKGTPAPQLELTVSQKSWTCDRQFVVDPSAMARGPEGRLVAAGDYGSFLTYDLDTPLAPQAKGQIVDIGRFAGITSSDTLAVWNRRGPFDIPSLNSLVVDLSTPSKPQPVGSVVRAEPSEFAPMSQSGDLLVVGQELRLFDLSDPSAPVELDRFSVDGPVSDIATEGELVVISHSGTEPTGPQNSYRPLLLKVARIEGSGANRQLIELASTMGWPNGWYAEVVVDGRTAWVSFYQGCSTQPRRWIMGFDLSNPSSPRRLGWVELPGLGRDLTAGLGDVLSHPLDLGLLVAPLVHLFVALGLARLHKVTVVAHIRLDLSGLGIEEEDALANGVQEAPVV
jgi:hypothetical protein